MSKHRHIGSENPNPRQEISAPITIELSLQQKLFQAMQKAANQQQLQDKSIGPKPSNPKFAGARIF